MQKLNLTHALALRLKKSQYTDFYYKLNDLCGRIKLYKASFEEQKMESDKQISVSIFLLISNQF